MKEYYFVQIRILQSKFGLLFINEVEPTLSRDWNVSQSLSANSEAPLSEQPRPVTLPAAAKTVSTATTLAVPSADHLTSYNILFIFSPSLPSNLLTNSLPPLTWAVLGETGGEAAFLLAALALCSRRVGETLQLGHHPAYTNKQIITILKNII